MLFLVLRCWCTYDLLYLLKKQFFIKFIIFYIVSKRKIWISKIFYLKLGRKKISRKLKCYIDIWKSHPDFNRINISIWHIDLCWSTAREYNTEGIIWSIESIITNISDASYEIYNRYQQYKKKHYDENSNENTHTRKCMPNWRMFHK